MRIEAVEAAIAHSVCRTAEALPESSRVFGRGYDALCTTCLRAPPEEMRAGDGAGKRRCGCHGRAAPCARSVDAAKRTRRKIGDRFSAKGLPFEANPDAFNALASSLA